MDGFGKGFGFVLGRLLMPVSGWDLVMRVHSMFCFLFSLFHTSNYCIAFFSLLLS